MLLTSRLSREVTLDLGPLLSSLGDFRRTLHPSSPRPLMVVDRCYSGRDSCLPFSWAIETCLDGISGQWLGKWGADTALTPVNRGYPGDILSPTCRWPMQVVAAPFGGGAVTGPGSHCRGGGDTQPVNRQNLSAPPICPLARLLHNPRRWSLNATVGGAKVQNHRRLARECGWLPGDCNTWGVCSHALQGLKLHVRFWSLGPLETQLFLSSM